ncbi:iron chelate uptake ABC transporter family permease subunit [Bogoriella caseilytica]|uniref:Iron complex transport system permease protein n=1 Tax=Bogoriella caseilytica TaxID=56055 RepID=A0A3N2BGF5_9MICO|nr:iron chelate uptake ABC transporter family permease subunit [Bogoriella caseilytica]ROR74298.1 iron complex transport system permease protein [Bogoriella caseilytica]
MSIRTGTSVSGAELPREQAPPDQQRMTPPLPERLMAREERHSRPITGRRHRRSYLLAVAVLGLVSLAATLGILFWNNPMPAGSAGWWTILGMRRDSLLTIGVVALCHSVATIAFQTGVNNRILTPGIMGFGSLYTAIQTVFVYLFGMAGVVMLVGVPQFFLQMALMMVLATALYTWLLSGRFSNVHIMLLVGVVIGGTLGSVSNFLQRMLTPSEFDVLTARLFGNISNARTEYLPYAIPIALVAAAVLFARAHRLNVISLGRNAALNLGLNHKRELIALLMLVSVLVSLATALVGPMMFLGFLAAMLSYQLADTYSHRHLFPMGFLAAYSILAGSYFVLRHLWDAGGAVTVIVELIGGVVFLIFLMRKGRL